MDAEWHDRQAADLPLSADVKGMIDGALIATLREDYAAERRAFRQRRAGRVSVTATRRRKLDLYAPGPRAAIESVGVGRDAIYAAITDNVIGAVHVFTTRWQKLERTQTRAAAGRLGRYRFGQ